MIKIALQNSCLVTLIDDSDFELVSKYKWNLSIDGPRNYVLTYVNRYPIRLHTMLMGGKCDHKDCDGLNNQRSNLRLCTDSQNQHNRRKLVKATSPYKGVRLLPSGKWQARAKQIYLGQFDTEIEAALAYDKKASQMYGEFARLNFPQSTT